MKTFKEFQREMVTTADVPGTGDDPATWIRPGKKRKQNLITRHYIEINGKRKKLTVG